MTLNKKVTDMITESLGMNFIPMSEIQDILRTKDSFDTNIEIENIFCDSIDHLSYDGVEVVDNEVNCMGFVYIDEQYKLLAFVDFETNLCEDGVEIGASKKHRALLSISPGLLEVEGVEEDI